MGGGLRTPGRAATARAARRLEGGLIPKLVQVSAPGPRAASWLAERVPASPWTVREGNSLVLYFQLPRDREVVPRYSSDAHDGPETVALKVVPLAAASELFPAGPSPDVLPRFENRWLHELLLGPGSAHRVRQRR